MKGSPEAFLQDLWVRTTYVCSTRNVPTPDRRVTLSTLKNLSLLNADPWIRLGTANPLRLYIFFNETGYMATVLKSKPRGKLEGKGKSSKEDADLRRSKKNAAKQ